ncbi:hypothetical protein Cpir12675_006141, partial [Ceratocystis pirilliformis]
VNGVKSYTKVDTVVIKSAAQAVPSYRSHLIEIPRNILAPYAPLTYVPHVRDIINPEDQTKWDEFVCDLRQQAHDSGFSHYFEQERIDRIQKQEAAIFVRSVIELWLRELAIPFVTKASLNLWHIFKSDPTAYDDWDNILGPPAAQKQLEAFTAAFNRVFNVASRFHIPVSLDDVIELDASDAASYSKLTRPTAEKDLDKCLETYQILQCLQCFSHSCEHANFDSLFHLVQDSLSYMNVKFSDLQKKAIDSRPYMALDSGTLQTLPCDNNCFLTSRCLVATAFLDRHMRRDETPWSQKEVEAFSAIAGTIPKVLDRRPASCIASVYLQRSCKLVYDYGLRYGLYPERECSSINASKLAPTLPWYDRFKKTLSGDWKRRTLAHLPDQLIISAACFHDGPCSESNCTCVQEKRFCQASCGCTVENCSYHFTGCACHSVGKTCIDKQRDRPCICLMLGRECDPSLCGFCGIKELVAPKNRAAMLAQTSFSSGCQNCDLQIGRIKKLVAGQSTISGVGYGLFAAEAIAEGDFVIEYLGEKVAADEGIRRGARRGEGFGDENEHGTCSYLFTILESEGVWVDGASFGNKSRYINHSRDMCNLVPCISFVINEHRIKFVAKRDIRVGEELFFDYGSNFPNLVDLMDRDKANRQHKSSQTEDEDYEDEVDHAPFAQSTGPKDIENDLGKASSKTRGSRRMSLNLSTQEQKILRKTASGVSSKLKRRADVVESSEASDDTGNLPVSVKRMRTGPIRNSRTEATSSPQWQKHDTEDEIQDSEYEDSSPSSLDE